jgi:hypothetical protein
MLVMIAAKAAVIPRFGGRSGRVDRSQRNSPHQPTG